MLPGGAGGWDALRGAVAAAGVAGGFSARYTDPDGDEVAVDTAPAGWRDCRWGDCGWGGLTGLIA
eukprot:gene11560-12402_t